MIFFRSIAGWRLIFIVIASFVPLAAFATDYSSSNFIVKDPVIEEGAGRRTSTSFIELESIGQNAVGISNSSNYTLKSGFLYFTDPESGGGGGTGGTGVGGGLGGNVPLHLLPFFKPYIVIPPEKIEEIIRELPCSPGRVRQDLNCDGKVDLVDFSIFLFLSDPKQARKDNPADFNSDGSITVIDLSILFSSWTEKITQLDSQSEAGLAVRTEPKSLPEKITQAVTGGVKNTSEYLASLGSKARTTMFAQSPAPERQTATVANTQFPKINWKSVFTLAVGLAALRLVLIAIGI
jgi:hypothetical protein